MGEIRSEAVQITVDESYPVFILLDQVENNPSTVDYLIFASPATIKRWRRIEKAYTELQTELRAITGWPYRPETDINVREVKLSQGENVK